MAKKEFSNIQIFVILTLVSIGSAGILAMTYNLTKKPIEQAEARKKELALKSVLPAQTVKITSQKLVLEGEEVEMNIGEGPDGASLGYAIQATTKKGYGGTVVFLLGLDPEGRITGYTVISHSETPGLGDGITSDKFKNQFQGKNLENFKFKVVKDGGDVQAITAATISSRAACEALEKGLNLFKAYKAQGSAQ